MTPAVVSTLITVLGGALVTVAFNAVLLMSRTSRRNRVLENQNSEAADWRHAVIRATRRHNLSLHLDGDADVLVLPEAPDWMTDPPAREPIIVLPTLQKGP